MKNLKRFIMLSVLMVCCSAVFAAGKKVDTIPDGNKMKKEIDELVADIENSVKNKSDKGDNWEKYTQKIRKDAQKNEERVKNFLKDASFLITLKRITFTKELGGFENTPICVVLPVRNKQILIGQQICTTPAPSFKRLFPAEKFAAELKNELKNTDGAITELKNQIAELNGNRKKLEDLLAKTMDDLAKNTANTNYKTEEERKLEAQRLNEAARLGKKQIKEITATVKKRERDAEMLNKRQKYLSMADAFITEQLTFYGVGEKNAAPAPQAK